MDLLVALVMTDERTIMIKLYLRSNQKILSLKIMFEQPY